MNTDNTILFKGFLKAWNLLPGGVQRVFREDVKTKCKWGKGKFYDALNGKADLSPLECEFLSDRFRDYNIDVRTGEYIRKIA